MIGYLRKNGIKNPIRTKRLICEAIDLNRLNLNGLTVLTEAASNNFVFTPIIAALAGAKRVYAITKTSKHGTTEDIAEFTYKYADFCGAKDRIEVLYERDPQKISQVDIVTNLGFVRPIDKTLVKMLKETAVITLMCESWECREGDIDLAFCRERNIPVMGVREDYPGKEIFEFCGILCLKMLFEVQIEVYKSKIAVASGDKFGKVIEAHLRNAGAEVCTFGDLRQNACREFLKDADALVVADYTSRRAWIGPDGQLSAEELSSISGGISVVQFCGAVDTTGLDRCGIVYFPSSKTGFRRMTRTLADLGPKPVVDLHCAGLKVGEAMARARLEGLSLDDFARKVFKESPAMALEES